MTYEKRRPGKKGIIRNDGKFEFRADKYVVLDMPVPEGNYPIYHQTPDKAKRKRQRRRTKRRNGWEHKFADVIVNSVV
jgi:hypothetical protein